MSIRSTLTFALFALVPACSAAQSHEHGHESHAGAADPVAAAGATSMGGAIVETPHLKLTATREPNARDSARAAEVLRDLRDGIDEYRDYRKAVEDGYRIFLPNVPMKVYHFTNYRRAFWEGRSFDARKPRARSCTSGAPTAATRSSARCTWRAETRRLTSCTRGFRSA